MKTIAITTTYNENKNHKNDNNNNDSNNNNESNHNNNNNNNNKSLFAYGVQCTAEHALYRKLIHHKIFAQEIKYQETI